MLQQAKFEVVSSLGLRKIETHIFSSYFREQAIMATDIKIEQRIAIVGNFRNLKTAALCCPVSVFTAAHTITFVSHAFLNQKQCIDFSLIEVR